MTKLASLVATLAIVAMLAASSMAQNWSYGGSMHLSFAPDAVVTEADIEPLQAFTFYLLVQGSELGYGVLGYEAVVSLHPDILFQSVRLLPSSSMNLGTGFADGEIDFVVGTGGCVAAAPVVAVVEFQGLLIEAAEDVFIGLAPHPLSSVDDVAPAWLGCNRIVYAAENDYVAAKLWINKGGVATDTSSWSSVKALY